MTCRPDLFEENEEAINVYLSCANQPVVVGMGTIIDLDFSALKFVMDLYDVKDKRTCFEKVIKVFRHFMELDRQLGKE